MSLKRQNTSSIIAVLIICMVSLFFSCKEKKSNAPSLFTTLESNYTGLQFNNKLSPTPEFNLFSYMYYYNGAGTGAGDFNNDGLIDLFFSANQSDNKLYLNRGGMKFEDITALASIPQDGGWSTGVSVIDINNDGLLDIYICKVGHYKTLNSHNQLLVCKGIDKNGIPFYEDEAKQYGLDFSGFGTQAAFFDYDMDGDLDVFLLNHSVNHDGNYAPRSNFLNTYDSLAGQKLYRNDIVKDAQGNSVRRFTDVTKESGIHGSKIGYGLGVAIADINLDGWPDFYVSNDFHENDYLYINQKNGTFSDEIEKRIMHTSQFSMGVDIADINNDGYPEIMTLDMLPYDPYILRRSLAQDDYTIFLQKLSFGYNYQYAKNNLQYNRRNGMFTETAQYSGVYATDWSWGTLFTDFDNDGHKDIFVSNGIPKRMNDIDYINFVSNDVMQEKLITKTIGEKDMALIEKFPEIKIPNQFFYNTGNLLFKEISAEVENTKPTFSNSAIYADLDNDGDLDIVVNNINDPVLVYKNTSNDSLKHTFAKINLKGSENNINAIGAKVVLFANGGIRTYENQPVHGFQSSMMLPLHIGLYNTKVDSAFLIWPDNSYQKIDIPPNKNVAFSYQKGLPAFNYNIITSWYKNPSRPVEDITQSLHLNYKHTENPFNEFNREPLIPRMLSAEGPALAIADINHDGLDDIFIGASKTFHNAVFLQTAAGNFVQTKQPAMAQDSMWENTDAVWADVNNDKNPDLIIATGGNEYYGNDAHLLPLLYLNDGKGNLTKKTDAFANINTTQSVVIANDFNSDGFIDLFIGSRAMPWDYGKMPQSYLLQNDGTGKFTDVTNKYFGSAGLAGFVTNVTWTDIDKNGIKDLIVCYEWGGVDAFINKKNSFERKVITDKKGWWNFILPCDIDGDGNIDFIAGNFGLNSPLKASPKEPVNLYYNDFDNNGKKEQVLTYYLMGQQIPFNTKMELEKQMPYLKKKYLYAGDFAKATLNDLFGANLKAADKLTADYFESAVLLNKGNYHFEIRPLPFEAQLTSLRAAIVVDANNDHLPDILLGGNYYYNNIEIGRQDGDFGTILINKGNGNFEAATLNPLVIHGQIRHIKQLQIGKSQALVLAKNNDSLQVIRFK